MAMLGFRRTVYKSGGREATGLVSYMTRERYRDNATRQLDYIAKDREDCVFTTSRNLPGWCHGDPQVYFAAAERHEGAGWVAFEELKITLPRELDHGQNMDLMRDVVQSIASNTLPICYAFHNPRTMDGQHEQPHLHLILSRRETDAYDRGPVQHFKRWQKEHPARGGARKDPAFAERLAQRHLRVLVSDVVNLHLEQAGIVERVHPGTLKSRGIDRQAEPKLFPKESREYREQGVVSTTMQTVLDIRADRQRTRTQEQVNARQYWESRKAELGLTRDMDLPDQLAVIRQARLARVTLAPVRAVVEAAVGVEMEERTVGEVARDAYESGESLAATLSRLEHALDGLSHEGGASGPRVKIRLWDKEQGQGWG